MNLSQSIFVFLVLLLAHSIQCLKPCDGNDVDCTTKVAKRFYKRLVNDAKVKTIDPLHLEKSVGDIITLKYELTDFSLTGMKNCNVLLLKKDTVALTYELQIQCPELIFDYNYHFAGSLESTAVNEEGLGRAKIVDYVIKLYGTYNEYSSDNQKHYFRFTKNNMDTDLKGKLSFTSKKITKGDQVKLDFALAYFNKNANLVEKAVKGTIINDFMSLFVNALNCYLEVIPLEELHTKDDK